MKIQVSKYRITSIQQSRLWLLSMKHNSNFSIETFMMH
jgi:hypothetical protein